MAIKVMHKHTVIVDTNILWCKDKGPVVEPMFDLQWSQLKDEYDIQLVIPEVVKEELLFQQTTSAKKLLLKAQKELEKLSEVAAVTENLNLGIDDVKSCIQEKFASWQKLTNATIISTPYKKIDWNEVCNAAIWHLPPFTNDPKGLDREKGFKDAVIMHTVIDYVTRLDNENYVIFLCHDNLLRETVQERLKGTTRFTCQENMEQLSSYLKLAKEEHAHKFIGSILQSANQLFYERDNENSLYLSKNIKQRIREEFSESFKPDAGWMLTEQGKYFISKPDFLGVSKEGRYLWETHIEFVEGYCNDFSDLDAKWLVMLGMMARQYFGSPSEKLLYVKLSIYWSSNVSSTGKLSKPKIDSLKVQNKEFRDVETKDTQRFEHITMQPKKYIVK